MDLSIARQVLYRPHGCSEQTHLTGWEHLSLRSQALASVSSSQPFPSPIGSHYKSRGQQPMLTLDTLWCNSCSTGSSGTKLVPTGLQLRPHPYLAPTHAPSFSPFSPEITSSINHCTRIPVPGSASRKPQLKQGTNGLFGRQSSLSHR